jgi:hypothetical protein
MGKHRYDLPSLAFAMLLLRGATGRPSSVLIPPNVSAAGATSSRGTSSPLRDAEL